MTEKQLKDYDKLWNKILNKEKLTSQEKKYFDELDDLWNVSQWEKTCESWKANQPV